MAMGPLQVSGHMVQKPPHWNANDRALPRTSKRKQVYLNFLCFRCPSVAVFVPCDNKLQKAYYSRDSKLHVGQKNNIGLGMTGDVLVDTTCRLP